MRVYEVFILISRHLLNAAARLATGVYQDYAGEVLVVAKHTKLTSIKIPNYESESLEV